MPIITKQLATDEQMRLRFVDAPFERMGQYRPQGGPITQMSDCSARQTRHNAVHTPRSRCSFRTNMSMRDHAAGRRCSDGAALTHLLIDS